MNTVWRLACLFVMLCGLYVMTDYPRGWQRMFGGGFFVFGLNELYEPRKPSGAAKEEKE